MYVSETATTAATGLTITGTSTTQFTASSTSNLLVGQWITGGNIPANAQISDISGTTVTIAEIGGRRATGRRHRA